MKVGYVNVRIEETRCGFGRSSCRQYLTNNSSVAKSGLISFQDRFHLSSQPSAVWLIASGDLVEVGIRHGRNTLP